MAQENPCRLFRSVPAFFDRNFFFAKLLFVKLANDLDYVGFDSEAAIWKFEGHRVEIHDSQGIESGDQFAIFGWG